MQSKQSEKYITLKSNKNNIDMSLDTYARWLSLLEAVDIVDKQIDKYGNRLMNKELDWVKPLAFQRYISERLDSMKSDIEESDNFVLSNSSL